MDLGTVFKLSLYGLTALVARSSVQRKVRAQTRTVRAAIWYCHFFLFPLWFAAIF